MSKLSRRKFIAAGLAAGPTPMLAGDANAAPFVRHNLATPPGAAMLEKYAKAVKIMMATPDKSPLSWTFQWYTHAVPTNTSKAAALNATYAPNPRPERSLRGQRW